MCSFLFAFVLLKVVNSEFNFCYNGIQTIKINDSLAKPLGFVHHCPSGVLFKYPQTIHSVEADLNGFCFKPSICPENEESWRCGMRKKSVDAQLITSHKGTKSFHGQKELFINDESITHTSPQCVQSESKNDPQSFSSPNQDDENNLRRKRATLDITDDSLSFDTIRAELKEQTKRMFYFLSGITPENVDSDLRSVTLFKKSAEIIRGSCDPMYLNSQFIDSIVKAFLFLLKEQGSEKIEDTSLEHYENLLSILDKCTSSDGFTLQLLPKGTDLNNNDTAGGTDSSSGQKCSSGNDIGLINRKDKDGNSVALPYFPDKDTFQWGKFDVIVDAAWHIVDFVHGICFNNFVSTINAYHHYQVAMEQLFKNSIRLRWHFNTELAKNSLYDNILLASVNDTFKILDACVHGAYIDSPFARRLDRPVLEENLAKEELRKKRFVSNDDSGNPLADTAYCLQTEKELDDRIAELRKTQCQNGKLNR